MVIFADVVYRTASKDSGPTDHKHVSFHLESAHSLSPVRVGPTAPVEEASPYRCGLTCCFLKGSAFSPHQVSLSSACMCVLWGLRGGASVGTVAPAV